MAPYFHRSPILRRVTQVFRTMGYAMAALAGGTIVWVGNPPFTTPYVLLAIVMLVGSVVSGLGTLTGRWIGELLGLPLLGTTVCVFALLTAEQTFTVDLWVGVPSVAILVAFGALLLSRWVDVFALAKAVTREAGSRG